MRYVPHRRGAGLLQGAIPKGPRSEDARRARGLNLRGVVVKLYPRDDPPPGTGVPAATYASVLTYGARRLVLPRVQISQAIGSQTTALVGGLRASTQTTSGMLDLDHVDAASLDGSHVVVSFFDDDLSQPFVSAVLEHPRAIEEVRPTKNDPDPLLFHWQGATWGLSGSGDFIVDLDSVTATSEFRGNVHLTLPRDGRFTLTIDGESAAVIEKSGGSARLVLGDGVFSAAIAERMKTLYERLTRYIYEDLVMLSPSGTAGPPAAAMPLQPPPAWDDSIASDHLKISGG